MRYYADTGFILSLHLLESTSGAAVSTMQTVTEPLPVTPLVAIEFRNALRLAVFRSHITESERFAAWESFQQDISNGVLEAIPLDFPKVVSEAESLCDQFSTATGVRTLDLLHVASARTLGRTDFLTFDKRQRALALASGLSIFP